MKFLVTGSAGLIGNQVVLDLSKSNNQIYSCYHNSKPKFGIPTQLDLLDFEKIPKVIDDTKPDVIIHLAAITNVEECERNKELASKINTKVTEIISKKADKNNIFLIYVSTDYVFDGVEGMRKENDTTNPLNHYGKSKLEGEKAVMKMKSNWCIARTSTPFGFHPKKKSFSIYVIENLRSKNTINVVTDQYTSPVYVPNVSEMIIELATRQITGLIHVAGGSRISRYEFAELIVEKLNLDKKLLKPATLDETNWITKRPKDCSLDVSHASSILNTKPQRIEKSIDLFTNDIKSNHYF